jgi:hypothetical protein
MPYFRKLSVILLTLVVGALSAKAQDAAIKTNVLGWAAGGTINAGVEVGLSRKVTLNVFGAVNPWDYANDKRVHLWNAEPEVRLWLCQKFQGHFFGLHLLGGEYNIRNVDVPFKTLPRQMVPGRHYEGWYVGGGITYGYQWMLSRHWNLEASIGVGYAYSPYWLYGRCDRILNHHHVNYVGLTKLAVSVMYCF